MHQNLNENITFLSVLEEKYKLCTPEEIRRVVMMKWYSDDNNNDDDDEPSGKVKIYRVFFFLTY